MATVDAPARDLYTSIGPTYQDAFTIPAQIESLKRLIALLPPNQRVLDIGCGTGRPAGEMLVAAGHTFEGIDVTPAMLEKAKHQLPNSKLEVADGRTWEPAPGQAPFDCIISFYAFLLHCTKAETKGFFPRAYSWLRPGGIFVYGTAPWDMEMVDTKWLGRDTTFSSLPPDQLRKELQSVGFEILDEVVGKFAPTKAPEVGLCREGDVWEEDHFILICRKPQ